MAKNNIAKTGDRPGVTKSKQWIKTSIRNGNVRYSRGIMAKI